MSSGVQTAPAQFVPSHSQLRVAYSVCRSITRSAAKNFYYAFLVLPRRKREALCAVYAFMRRCDDIADEAAVAVSERRNRLADWLDSLHDALSGEPTDDPVLLALADAKRRFKIPMELLDQLAYGTAMDLQDSGPQEGTPRLAANELIARYRTFDDLRQYCYRVASVVGLVCIRIFGYRDPCAEPLAERCGLAFQLTNIIRDVKEDAAMFRVYLPQEDLARFGLAATELRMPQISRFRPLLAMEADRAREFYRSADDLIPLVAEDSQPALWVLVTIYRQLLEKIAAREYDVFGEKISLTVWEKVKVLMKGFWKRVA